MTHMRQLRPDSGLGFQATVLEEFEVCSLFARKRPGNDFPQEALFQKKLQLVKRSLVCGICTVVLHNAFIDEF